MSSAKPGGQRVVHLVGKLTDSVHRLLGPATDTLSQAGCRQAVVLLQDPMNPGLVGDFDPTVERVVLPLGRNPVARWRRWVRAARHTLAQEPADVVHLHGFVPSLLAGPLINRFAAGRRLYSPHDSRTQQPSGMPHRLAGWLLRPVLAHIGAVAVVGMPSEARVLGALPGLPVEQLDMPVDPAYFYAPRRPARHPLIVGGVFDAPQVCAGRLAQLAVLMGSGQGGLSFNWLGAAWGRAREQLDAASVAIVDERQPRLRATRLAAAWVYLCPHADRGLPAQVAEAMACGLPVVAVDAPVFRDLIIEGETGYLCADDKAMIDRVHALVSDADLRARLGDAARAVAWSRFGGAGFEQHLIQAYAGVLSGPSTNFQDPRAADRRTRAGPSPEPPWSHP